MSLQVESLERSFEQIKPSANDFAASFYDNLFTDYPEAKPLFTHTDMEEQKKKLLQSLILVIQNLRNPDVLGGALKGLGARHVKYGALPEHYPLVGNSLLKTFEQYLGNDWTPAVKQAWVDAYGAISEIMLEGADYTAEDLALDTAVPTPAAPEPESAEDGGLQVERLESSFAQIVPEADAFSHSFYNNLFTDYPDAKPLFAHTNMKEQEKKLVQSLVLVIQNLRNPDALTGALKGLGARHVKYGALPEHYPLVGNTLLKTFGEYLGTDWTPAVKQAWVDAYGAITEIMLDGADYDQAEVQLTPEPSEAAEAPVAAAPVAPAGPTVTSAADVAPTAPAEMEAGEKGLLGLLAGGVVAVIIAALFLA